MDEKGMEGYSYDFLRESSGIQKISKNWYFFFASFFDPLALKLCFRIMEKLLDEDKSGMENLCYACDTCVPYVFLKGLRAWFSQNSPQERSQNATETSGNFPADWSPGVALD